MKYGLLTSKTDGYEIKDEVEEYDEAREAEYRATIEAGSKENAEDVAVMWSWVRCMQIAEESGGAV